MRCAGCIFKGVYEDMGARIDTCRLQDYLPDAVKACDNSANCSHRVTWDEAKRKCLSPDVVEVVRFRDCKHNVANWEHDELDIGDYTDITCDYFMTDGMEADDFCCRGERIEG
jgi:hypothetical protein